MITSTLSLRRTWRIPPQQQLLIRKDQRARGEPLCSFQLIRSLLRHTKGIIKLCWAQNHNPSNQFEGGTIR